MLANCECHIKSHTKKHTRRTGTFLHKLNLRGYSANFIYGSNNFRPFKRSSSSVAGHQSLHFVCGCPGCCVSAASSRPLTRPLPPCFGLEFQSPLFLVPRCILPTGRGRGRHITRRPASPAPVAAAPETVPTHWRHWQPVYRGVAAVFRSPAVGERDRRGGVRAGCL